MPSFDAIGVNAVGASSNTVSSSLSCSATASALLTTSLTTTIRLGATVAATVVLTASLASGGTRFASNPIAVSSVFSTLVTQITMQTNAQSASLLLADITPGQAAPTFTPSAARTIFVQSASPVFTGSKWWNLADSKKPRGLKDPDATIDITFDWSDWLNDISPAVISDVTFTPLGVDTVQVFHDSTTATIFISGGVIGSPATLACKIQTNTTPSRTDERTVYIDIADE